MVEQWLTHLDAPSSVGRLEALVPGGAAALAHLIDLGFVLREDDQVVSVVLAETSQAIPEWRRRGLLKRVTNQEPAAGLLDQ